MVSPSQGPVVSHAHHHLPIMFNLLNKTLRRLWPRLLRWPKRRRVRPKLSIKRLGKPTTPKRQPQNKTTTTTTTITNSNNNNGSSAMFRPNNNTTSPKPKPIRIATFNAALFSMAPALPETPKTATTISNDQNSNNNNNALKLHAKSPNERRPKSILKHSPLHPSSMNVPEPHKKLPKSKLRVSINLPDNEISLLRSRQSSFSEHEKGNNWRNIVMRQCASFSSFEGYNNNNNNNNNGNGCDDVYGIRSNSRRTVVEVLRELDADVLGLQDVKAEEANGMKPLSDLAKALGMNYVFAESWAPEYGNAVLSRWPIKRWNVQKVFDDTDFRNVLKATIDVPQAGELNFYCTHLDHLDENWRMKQINAIIQSNDEPHILAGGLNSLDELDYSHERWTDIVKYYEEMGKPIPKVEVMKYLKGRNYTDARDFAGECESVVMIAKGQSVQGTCKYGTRVDYILSSSDSPYKFVPGSYLVHSSKGTSDHHIVKVDVVKVNSNPTSPQENITKKQRQPRQKVARITHSSPSTCIWKTHSVETN